MRAKCSECAESAQSRAIGVFEMRGHSSEQVIANRIERRCDHHPRNVKPLEYRARHSPERFAFNHISGGIDDLNFIDGFEMGMVGEFPDDFLFRRHLDHLRLLADEAVADEVANNRVPIRQALNAGGNAQRVARQFVLVDYDVPLSLLEEATAITPGIESPTISPLHDPEWVAVRAMVPRADTNHIMDDLYELGARAILVTSILAARL